MCLTVQLKNYHLIYLPWFILTEPSQSSPLPDIEIQELQGSPTSLKKRPPSSPESDGQSSPSSPSDASWPRRVSPRRKNEKEVFKFLKESDPNYTIRRQQLQMNLILEKNQHVKKVGVATYMYHRHGNEIDRGRKNAAACIYIPRIY